MLSIDPERAPSPRKQSMDPVSPYIHLEDLPTPGSRFEILELLGTGTRSKVYAALDKQKGDKVAIKVIEGIAENLLEIESEYRVLSDIGGRPLIPEFHGIYLHIPKGGNRQLWFVMELCEGVPISDLLLYLRKEGKRLREEEIAALLKGFMMAIHQLHSNEIIHRDLRASNFILSPEGSLKLIDYGTCAFVRDTEGKTHSSIGTPHWMAPEVVACDQLRPYTKSCDIWSLGITAIELAETQPPLFDIHPIRAMFQIARNPPPMVKKVAEWTETFKDFINECLVRNADHRPCILELLLHPFITEMDDFTDQSLSLEEHLQNDFQPTAGVRVKKILSMLGGVMAEQLQPRIPSVPISMTVKNWHFTSGPDSPYIKMMPDDLAASENANEDSILEYLHHRFFQDKIYTYIGDVLIAMNPKKKLQIYDSKTQVNYWEKARSDNPPHVFAVADRAYQQMLHHKRSQVIIIFGKNNSGKSFSATQIINQLSFLSPETNTVRMAEKMQELCILLDCFGCAQTIYNPNASRYLKTIGITFTKTGKITGGIIRSTLLDRTRISCIPENESNFHILYYVYEGLKAEKRLAEFGLDKLSTFRYLPQKSTKHSADLVAGYRNICHAFRTLSFTEEEISVILRILCAILLLGDVTYTSKGSSATANNPYLIASAAKNLSVDNEKLQGVICKGSCIEDVNKKRDAWVQFLYLRVFEWIVMSINKQLSFSRLVLGDCYSITVVDPPGFGTQEQNQMFRLCANVIDDFLQNFIRELMFFKELEEYHEEDVKVPFKHEDSTQERQFLNNLVNSEKKLLKCLQNSGVKEKLKALPKECIEVSNNSLSIHHLFQTVRYNIQDLTTDNLTVNEAEFGNTFQSTDDNLTLAIANKVPGTTSPLPEQMQELLPDVIKCITEDFPHLVVCMQPSPISKEDVKFESEYVVQQLRAFNLMETIMLRQKGYARRLSFTEFLNRYKYLAFDFDEEVELTKENCQLLLIRLKMDGWVIGKNKIFLKYYTEEYLARLYETHVKKIIKVQAMARRFLVKTRKGRGI